MQSSDWTIGRPVAFVYCRPKPVDILEKEMESKAGDFIDFFELLAKNVKKPSDNN